MAVTVIVSAFQSADARERCEMLEEIELVERRAAVEEMIRKIDVDRSENFLARLKPRHRDGFACWIELVEAGQKLRRDSIRAL